MDEKKYTIEEFVSIIERLRAKDGCPWDREQTHSTLKNCMIEEAYEVVQGIYDYEQTKDAANLCEELGDVLLQVVMHSVIAEEEGVFTFSNVIDGISKKMIRRHPHVFGKVEAEDSQEVLKNWEQIKREEKREHSVSESLFHVARALPANIRAEKIQKKAAKAGLEFESYEQVLAKVYEELEELEIARKNGVQEQIEEEFGDILFTIINLSRFLQLNVENSLTNATDKFINRFVDVERIAISQGKHLSELSVQELDTLWGQAKKKKS